MRQRKNYTLTLLLSWLIFALNIHAQEHVTVSGIVLDNSGETLIGVNIQIEGVAVGTITDFDGNFSLSIPANTKTLSVSYVGYQSQIVAVQKQPMRIVLLEENFELDELVVVGYATQKKANLTGAVASVDMDNLTSRSTFNTESLLQGQVAGVSIVNAGSQPGGGTTVRVRGVGTIGSGESPLVLIDGVEGDMSDVAATDIENMSVLKDAASCAIYGARAANGVVLITTKTGSKQDKNVIKYDGSFSLQKATVLPDLLNAQQYAELMNEAYSNAGMSQPFTGDVLDFINSGATSDMLGNTDWADELFRTAPMTQHNLSFSGNRENLTYMLSVGYQNQEGIMVGTAADRLQTRLNLSITPYKWLKVGTNISAYTKSTTSPTTGASGSDGIMNMICNASPLCPVYYSDGRYATAIDDSTGMPNVANPLYAANLTQEQVSNNIQTKFFADITLLKNLIFSTNVSYRLLDSGTTSFTPTVQNYDYTGEVATTSVVNATLKEVSATNSELGTESTIQYDITLADKHNLKFLGGYSFLEYSTSSRTSQIQGFTDNSIQVPDGGTENAKFSGADYVYTLQSLFGRVNYNYQERYLFEANFRYDGSSRFPTDNQYGFFPSFSAAWRISEEAFFQDLNWGAVDNLKFRASWGQLGNQDIDYYPYQQTLSTSSYIDGSGSITPALALTSLANENITWETTTITNLGLDFGFFGNRLSGTFEVYRKITDDILLQLPIASVMGSMTAPYENAGVVQNQGWEFALNYSDRIGAVNYSVGGNISQLENKILDLGGYTFYPSDQTVHMEGYPVGAFYGYMVEGVFSPQVTTTDPYGNPWEDGEREMTAQQIIDYYAAVQTGAEPGDFQYKNLYDSEEELEATGGKGEINSSDRTVIGNPYPEFEYSFTGSLGWREFDFSFMFQGVQNVDIYTYGTANIPGSNDRMNLTTEWLNRSIPSEGIYTDYPRLEVSNTMNTQASDFWVEDASYLRLKNVELGYNVPNKLLNKTAISKLRVYVSAQNMLTFTAIENWDPERLSSSTENAAYPQAKTYTIGVSAQF